MALVKAVGWKFYDPKYWVLINRRHDEESAKTVATFGCWRNKEAFQADPTYKRYPLYMLYTINLTFTGDELTKAECYALAKLPILVPDPANPGEFIDSNPLTGAIDD